MRHGGQRKFSLQELGMKPASSHPVIALSGFTTRQMAEKVIEITRRLTGDQARLVQISPQWYHVQRFNGSRWVTA